MGEANCRIEYFKPIKIRKIEQYRTQYSQEGKAKEPKNGDDADSFYYFGDKKKYFCFKYKYFRPEILCARYYKYTTKKDSKPINLPEVVEKKVKELKVAKKAYEHSTNG